MGFHEKPLAFRRLQLQLMTPEQAKGHIEFLSSNALCVPEKTGRPLCRNLVTAMLEAKARLDTADTHFDPTVFAQARKAAKDRLGTVAGIPKLQFLEKEEPRLARSYIQEQYFAIVADHCEADEGEADWQAELQMLAVKACEGQARDRQRWEEVAALEAKKTKEAAEAAAE
jgi:hypothetical protein